MKKEKGCVCVCVCVCASEGLNWIDVWITKYLDLLSVDKEKDKYKKQEQKKIKESLWE